MYTERLESMSPNGFLRLFRQDDGDIVLTIGQSDGDEESAISRFATVEFCTPFGGGGGSPRTYAALIQLMGAMAEDNLDQSLGRRPEYLDDDEQKSLVEWARQCREMKF